MVLRVHLEVLGEVRDSLRKERDLHLGGPGVARNAGEFLYNLCLFNCGQTHVTLSFSLFFCGSMAYETPVESTPEPGFLRSRKALHRRGEHVEGPQGPHRPG